MSRYKLQKKAPPLMERKRPELVSGRREASHLVELISTSG